MKLHVRGAGTEFTLGQSNYLISTVTIGEHGDEEQAERMIGRFARVLSMKLAVFLLAKSRLSKTGVEIVNRADRELGLVKSTVRAKALRPRSSTRLVPR